MNDFGFLVFAATTGLISSYLAKKKGWNATLWFCLGFVFNILALIPLAIIKKTGVAPVASNVANATNTNRNTGIDLKNLNGKQVLFLTVGLVVLVFLIQMAQSDPEAVARRAKEEAERVEYARVLAIKSAGRLMTERAKALFKDPASVTYSDVYVKEDMTLICGQVNAKNSFGAYTGIEPFAYAKEVGLISDAGVVRNLCTRSGVKYISLKSVM
ncbi:MAG: hypothetical protein Q8S20_09715 [Sulfuritalea sp.]|nr:hypothetical protein [Sulfuritalea sp.]